MARFVGVMPGIGQHKVHIIFAVIGWKDFGEGKSADASSSVHFIALLLLTSARNLSLILLDLLAERVLRRESVGIEAAQLLVAFPG